MIIAKTKPLRDWCARASSDSRLVEGYKLPADFNKFPNSTWLVYSAAKTGSKNSKGGRKELPFKAAFDFNEFGRQADKSELIFRITGIRGITTRTFRKMVAQFNQDKFGLKSASLHAGHSNETVTNDHYVGTEERKANINTTLRVLTSSLVENLAGRRLDFSEIFLNTEYIHEPSVASKAIKNLKLIRENMGCSNPQKPSMNVSNNGLSGASECPFDRCVMCNNAYLFSDSYIFLARRLAELDHLIVRLPNIALTVKEFQAERLNLELILSEGYEATNWKEIHKSWFERFAAGEFISSY